MKYILAISVLLISTGCSLLPRDHDPIMLQQLVIVSLQVESVDCNQPDWKPALDQSHILSRYSQWRGDPQSDNITGLHKHVERMNKGGSKTFCELGKKTAAGRINAAKTAWEGR